MRVGKRQFTVYVKKVKLLVTLRRDCRKKIYEATPDNGNGAAEPSMSHTQTVSYYTNIEMTLGLAVLSFRYAAYGATAGENVLPWLKSVGAFEEELM